MCHDRAEEGEFESCCKDGVIAVVRADGHAACRAIETRVSDSSDPLVRAGFSSRIAKAGSWSVGGKLIARLIDLGSLVVLATVLDPASFGLVAQAMSVILIVEAVTSMPVMQPILRIADPASNVYDTAFTLSFLRAVAIAAIAALLATPVAGYFQEPRLPGLLITLALAPILRGSVSPRMAEFLRAYDLWPEVISDVLAKIVSFVFIFITAVLTQSYWAIAVGTITTAFMLNVMSYVHAPYRPRFSLRHWRDFADVLGWNTLTQIMQAINWQLDRILLGRILPTDLFGQYAVSSNLSEMPQQGVSVPLLRPMMVSFSEVTTDARRGELWTRFSNALLFVVGPVLIGVAMLSEAVVQVLLGRDWQGAAAFLFGLSLVAVIELPGLALNPLAVACYRAGVVALRVTVQLCLTIPLMIAGTYFFGALGAIAVKAGIAVVIFGLTLFVVRSLIGLPILQQMAALWRTALGLCVMTLVLFVMRDHVLATGGRISLAIRAFAVFGVAWMAFLAVTMQLWFLAGKRPGIEQFLLSRIGFKV